MNKKYWLIGLVLLFLASGFGLYRYSIICDNSPECACKNAPMGDPTCMSLEDLTEWCLAQKNSISLPQCMGLKGFYPVEEIIQKIIDYPSLQAYLHPETEGRIPLKISDYLINSNLYLEKFNTEVQIIKDESIDGAYIRFTTFECKSQNHCDVSFEYKVEGLSAKSKIKLQKGNNVHVEKMDIYEN